MLELRQEIERIARSDAKVLITGESGVGKELVAQAIHVNSPRVERPFVPVNCAGLPETLLESELFGHVKGSFTGAYRDKPGKLELAHEGTVFLDEVGEMTLRMQGLFLRFLETGEIQKVGADRVIGTVNVRVIAATNRNLTELIAQGQFREDLFYRLNVFPIRVPPLRERPEDIPPLVWTFVEEFSSRMGKKITQVPRKTMEALQRHAWPGNVRELRNVIEHAAIVSTGETLNLDLLDDTRRAATQAKTLADAERDLISQTLERTAWRIKGPGGAATQLGLKPATLYSRMKKLGIKRAAN
jgi:transcriptional regulator with GAF, ATPase, and Fis domain